MAGTSYVALLRGINVGGRNKVPMADLRAAFEGAGYEAVRTYIQSGNVLFGTDAPAQGLAEDIEELLERRLGVPLVVVVRSHDLLRAIVDDAPDGFGQEPDRYHSDVLFLRPPLTPAQVMDIVQLREEVDQAWPGEGVVYFARLSERRAQSRMNKLVGTPEYQRLSIRNWRTTTTLLQLLDDADAPG